MRILSVYNYYLNRGGEDEVFDTEAALLELHGHEVLRYSKSNKDIDTLNPLHLGAMILWNLGFPGNCGHRPYAPARHSSLP